MTRTFVPWYFALAFVPVSALGQASRPIQMAPVPMRPASAQQTLQRADAIRVNLKPDLIVKEMRIEGDKAVHVLVANNGTAASGKFTIEMAGSSERGASYPAMTVMDSDKGLAAGEERWVKFGNFVYELGQPSSGLVPLNQVDVFSVQLDSYHDTDKGNGGWFLGVPTDPTAALRPAEKNPCKPLVGCIAELDETNNSLSVSRADMTAW